MTSMKSVKKFSNYFEISHSDGNARRTKKSVGLVKKCDTSLFLAKLALIKTFLTKIG